VQTPTRLTDEQRQLFEQLAATFERKGRAVATDNGQHGKEKDQRNDKGFFERVKEAIIGPDDE
jgi:DnaJ-class molecular chaperone